MGYATILDLQKGLEHNHQFSQLISEGVKTFDKLQELRELSETIDLAKDGHLVQTSLESILRASPCRVEVSVEAVNPDGVIAKVINAIKRVIQWLINKLKAFVQWAAQVYLRSQRRRNAIKKSLKEQLAAANVYQGVYAPVRISGAQSVYLQVNGTIAADFKQQVKLVRDVMTEHRVSNYQRRIRELIKVTDLKDMDFDTMTVMRNRLVEILTMAVQQFKPVKSVSQYVVEHHLIGNRNVAYTQMTLPLQVNNLEGFGYHLLEVPSGVTEPSVVVDYVNASDIIQHLKNLQDLVAEVDQFETVAKEATDGQKRMIGNAERYAKQIERLDAAQVTPDQLRNLREAVQLIVTVSETTAPFLMALYVHGLTIASTHTTLLEAITSTADK